MLTLEKYKGSASRHTCPACGHKKKFTRYIDTETGQYIADHVGRCDRESACGYHLKPGEYFAENRINWTPKKEDRTARPENQKRLTGLQFAKACGKKAGLYRKAASDHFTWKLRAKRFCAIPL